MGECQIMILSEYMYHDIVSRRSGDGLLVPMSEIYGENVPAGAMSDGFGIRLTDTGAYKNLASFRAIPDDAVICIKRPFVFNEKANKDAYQFAVDYFKSIVSFGE